MLGSGLFAQNNRNPMNLISAGLPPWQKPKVAVCVGISEYNSDFDDLEDAATDADKVCTALHKDGYTRSVLKDEDATNDKIEDKIKIAATQLSNGGTFVFFFAGHGRADGDEQYLVTRGIHQADVLKGALTVKWVVDQLANSNATQRIVVVDACRTAKGKRADKETDGVRPTRYGNATAVLYSTDDGHPSWESPPLGGIFTQALVEGLDARSKSWSGDDLHLTSLYQFILQRTVELANLLGKRQTPQIMYPSGLAVEEIWIARKVALPTNRALLIASEANRFSSEDDMQAFAERLNKAGYTDVMTVLNPDPLTLQQKVTKFTDGLGENDRALVYFSGPGEVIDGEVYLNPVFTKNELEYTQGQVERAPLSRRKPTLDSAKANLIRDQALSLQCIVQRLRRGPNGQNIVILDTSLKEMGSGAARPAPDVRNEDDLRTLAIVFATGWDQYAREEQTGDHHGVFTNRLLPIVEAGKSVGDMLNSIERDVLADTQDRQKPWILPEAGRRLEISPRIP
jgi:uncharacterized caspase-like protein